MVYLALRKKYFIKQLHIIKTNKYYLIMFLQSLLFNINENVHSAECTLVLKNILLTHEKVKVKYKSVENKNTQSLN